MTATINASTSSGIVQTADTSGELALQSNGTTKLTVSSTGVAITGATLNGASITSFGGGVITSGTAQASTSGTSIDFTGIPSWVKRVTVMFNGVSTSGTSQMQVQIGAGSVTTSGYLSVGGDFVISGGVGGTTSTTGFVTGDNVSNAVRHGHMVITSFGSNIWVSSHTIGSTTSNYVALGGGSIALSGTLDRVRITTVNGTDTFDAGSINILFEG